MTELELGVYENGHLAEYEHPQLAGVEISGEQLTLNFDPIHSDTEELTINIENLERLRLTLD